jgi:serine/threonine-protein kinase
MAAVKEIGGIQIFAEIQQGATTLVFKGYQSALDRMVLLKVLRPEFSQDSDLTRRFEEEARLTAKLQHPNVAAIYDYGRDGEWPYIAAEFVEGFNLGELIQQRILPPELAAFILLECGRGLKAAHDKGILHRDIKPSNILVSHEGQVKLTDFGMASLRDNDKREQEVSGTLAYLAPEQILGNAASPSSDIFSLGATFFEMIAGDPAFTGKNTVDLFEAILHADPFSKISSVAFPNLSRAICAKLLAKDQQQRYGDCDALIKDIETSNAIANAEDLRDFVFDPHSYVAKPPAVSIPVAIPQKPPRQIWSTVVAIILITAVASAIGFSFLPKKETVDSHSDSQAALLPSLDSSWAKDNQFEDAKPTPAAARLEPEVTQPEKQQPKPVSVTTAETDSTHVGEAATANPVHELGDLSIVCTPWAAVFINGDSMGTTPMRSPLTLPLGRYDLALRNPEFPDYSNSIELSKENTIVEISLWSLVGTLKLDVSPWAEVYIDGVYKDTVPPQERPLIISPGKHLLALKHPQLGLWETSVEIAAGKSLEMKFNLKNLLAK